MLVLFRCDSLRGEGGQAGSWSYFALGFAFGEDLDGGGGAAFDTHFLETDAGFGQGLSFEGAMQGGDPSADEEEDGNGDTAPGPELLMAIRAKVQKSCHRGEGGVCCIRHVLGADHPCQQAPTAHKKCGDEAGGGSCQRQRRHDGPRLAHAPSIRQNPGAGEPPTLGG